MENKELIETEHKFLTDKEWWIEEKDNQYFLFVKHNNKTYSSSVDKKRIEFAKNAGIIGLQKGWISILVQRIELKIKLFEIYGKGFGFDN